MSEIVLETRRLVLRAWRIEDAKSLFRYAKEPLIGRGQVGRLTNQRKKAGK